ncbi:MAG: glycosyltransferase family 4 protein [Vicinamibacteria bacterium]
MKILYVASDQQVPGRTGGSVHVLEVARGLAGRGHEVHAVVRAGGGGAAAERCDGVWWHRIDWWPPHRLFRFRARPAIARLLAETGAQALMERYYNFGGEGVLAAHERGVPSLLEVNSPVLDHPGSWKARLDALLVTRPLRRYREELLRRAAAVVAPLPEIVPLEARQKTQIVTWGANVEAFSPERRRPGTRDELGIPRDACVVLFSGSFRPWHGVHVFEAAARLLRRRQDLFFLLVGGARAGAAESFRGRYTGAMPYERMPELVAAADVGVAPYDTARLAQLQLGFYWSPLKIFEYMASGLPSVTLPRAPLTEIVRDGREGLHFREADPAALAAAIERLADDAALRARLGASARERVVAHYSWALHCAQLEGVLLRMVA